jgi:hypothetical protein
MEAVKQSASFATSSSLVVRCGADVPVDAGHAVGDVKGEDGDLVWHLRPLLPARDGLGSCVGEHPADVALRRAHGGAAPFAAHEGDNEVLRAEAAAGGFNLRWYLASATKRCSSRGNELRSSECQLAEARKESQTGIINQEEQAIARGELYWKFLLAIRRISFQGNVLGAQAAVGCVLFRPWEACVFASRSVSG